MAKQIITILDDLSPSKIKLRNLPRRPDGLMNLHFNEYGQLTKRAGYAKYNTIAIDAEPSDPDHKIVGMHRFYRHNTANKEFLVAWNDNIYKLSETTPWGATSIKSGLTADSDTYFYDFYNHCYIVNGANTMMKYNLTNVRTVGITVPTAPTFSANINGSLGTGTYYFKVTYVDEDEYESNSSTASLTMSALADPSDGITITIPKSTTDPKVTKRRIYRTSVNGAIYYYDGEVADNTTLTYNSTKADTALGTKLHTDHTAPPSTPHLGTKRKNRAFVADSNIVYASGLTKPEYFPIETGHYLYTGNEEKVTGMSEQLNALPVFTDDSIERLVGTDKDNFEFKNAYSAEGCIAPRSLVNCDNLLVYLQYDGIFYFDGVTSGLFSKAVNEYIKSNMNYTYAHLSCATYWNDRYMLCYSKGENTVPSETIYLDLKNKTFGVYSYAFSCFSLWNRGTDGLRLFGGSNTEGRVYEVTGLEDDTAAIEAYDRIEPFSFGNPDKYKQIYHFYIKCKTTTGTALRFYYTLDNSAETYVDKTLTANTTAWYKIDFVGGGQRCREIAIRPRMNDKSYFEIHGYAIVFEGEAPEWS